MLKGIRVQYIPVDPSHGLTETGASGVVQASAETPSGEVVSQVDLPLAIQAAGGSEVRGTLVAVREAIIMLEQMAP